MGKKDAKHPYLRGYIFWAPILTEWINSENYSKQGKETLKESLEQLESSRNLIEFEHNAAWK